jgi:predicted membrane channel-forming protein YqfA (hemolysin III family)
MFLLLLLIALWGFVVVTVAEWLPELPWPLEALFFIAAGIMWILPLKPMLRWMELGKWRQ